MKTALKSTAALVLTLGFAGSAMADYFNYGGPKPGWHIDSGGRSVTTTRVWSSTGKYYIGPRR
ncbi:exported hypothetical protein [Gammaproteobacteria bacterium]